MTAGTYRIHLRVAVLLACGLAGCNSGDPGILKGSSTESRTTASDHNLAGPNCDAPADAAEEADRLLRLVNLARFNVGPVALDPDLAAQAEDYACSMIAGGFFGHTNPQTGVGLAERGVASGYKYIAIGENLAAGFWSAQDVVDAWLESDAHREVLLDPMFTRTGIAVRYGGLHQVYWVQIFADPAE